MAHHVAPRVERDLDDIWYYAAKESGSMEIANRLIDNIADRFLLLARSPFSWAVPATTILALVLAVLQLETM